MDASGVEPPRMSPLSRMKDLRKDRPQILLHELDVTERARMNEID